MDVRKGVKAPIALKAEALRRAAVRVLVADAEKWKRPAAAHFAPWSAFNCLVGNHDLPGHVRDALATARVALVGAGSF